MPIYTVLPDGETRSTSDLDAKFEDARNTRTTDAFVKPCELLLAQQAEAIANAFSARHRDFGDGNNSAGEWYMKASKHYAQHSESLKEQARSSWRKK